ncbi:AIPR family protein [Clostridium perfringens]|uniref:AIPR family protein n=1 Tax=Clostridium perfringens TaxID=1502 RepID=UPI0023FA1993|nr:AIPR family protein [Clostridium perfringens]WEV19203.1 AIPR family protein [Clostridium perfringens D]
MKNVIIKNFLKQFKEKFEIEENDEALVFEQFINYCILNNHIIDSEKNFNEMDTGTAKAIDGVAILINNKMILNEEDLMQLIANKTVLSVDFIFVQTKSADHFDDKEVNYFFKYIKKFIEEEECSIKELEKFWEIKNIIYENSHLFRKGNPNCIMYYANCSSTTELSADLKETIEEGKRAIENTSLISEKLEFIPLGIKEIQKLYRKIDADLEAQFNFPKHVTFSYDDDKITSAYFGIVDIREYVKLLLDSETKGIKNVFEDNIRDYLGVENNDVNRNMKERLLGEESQLFGILNNGVTIVADEIKPVGEKFNLINYQVVNGCQTSNVIFENIGDLEDKNIAIPLKIIATKDEATKNEIIKSTNSQTGLKPEQLDALNSFHRMLEDFYYSKNNLIKGNKNKIKLYYERRLNQYRNEDIPQTKIINISKQIKSVASMFLDNPHGVSGHYGTVIKKVKDNIFKENDKPEVYYVSALLLYYVESFFRKNREYKSMSRMKWHILMTIKHMHEKKDFSDKLNSKEVVKLCKSIEKELSNEESANMLIMNAINIINDMIKEKDLDINDRKIFERKETTEYLKEFLFKIESFQLRISL